MCSCLLKLGETESPPPTLQLTSVHLGEQDGWGERKRVEREEREEDRRKDEVFKGPYLCEYNLLVKFPPVFNRFMCIAGKHILLCQFNVYKLLYLSALRFLLLKS